MHQAAATASAILARQRTFTGWMWLAPFAAAPFYPYALDRFHNAYVGAHAMGPMAWLYLLAAYAIPALGLLFAWRLGAAAPQDLGPARLRAARLAQLVVAAPPMFTLLGVLLYLMKIAGHDGAVWLGLWCAFALGAALVTLTAGEQGRALATMPLAPADDPHRHALLRAAHGISAVLLLAVFLLPHLFNHLAGLGGLELHRAIMKTLRLLYRNGFVEPLLIGIFFFQIISGLVLYRRKSASSRDLLDVLQTSSGVYLSIYIAGHINSVFTLARYFGTETDFAWAVGAPVGLLADPWDIRLLPHYSLAVLFLIAHLAGATRLVLRKHGAPARRADGAAWCIVLLGLLLSGAITAAMLGYTVFR